jgi:hypothetical protein
MCRTMMMMMSIGTETFVTFVTQPEVAPAELPQAEVVQAEVFQAEVVPAELPPMPPQADWDGDEATATKRRRRSDGDALPLADQGRRAVVGGRDEREI